MKKILLAVLLVVGVVAVGASSVHAAGVKSVGMIPLQQTLSYSNGSYTGSISVMVSNSGTTCMTVPKTFSLGGQTVSVASRTVDGDASWKNDSQICGTGNYSVTVAIQAQPSSGTLFTPGTYTYTITSDIAGYQQLSADLIVPQVKYHVTSYNLAQYSDKLFWVDNCNVSEPMNGHPAGDYGMCKIVPINNTNQNKSYSSVFIQDGFAGATGDYIGSYINLPGVETTQLYNYFARVSGGIFYSGSVTKSITKVYHAMRWTGSAWKSEIITEVAIDTPYDFSNMNSIMVYSPQAVTTSGGSSGTLSSSWSCQGSQPYVNLSWKQVNPTASYFRIERFAQGSYNGTTITDSASARTLSYTDNTPAQNTRYTYYIFPDVRIAPLQQLDVSVGTCAAPKTITIKTPPDGSSYSFPANSANTSLTVPVTITATGFSDANQIISKANYNTPPLVDYINGAGFAITSSDIVNGVLTVHENLTITRNGNSSTTVITGPLTITATSTDGVTKGDSITINIIINIGTPPPTCSLSLTPTTAVKSFGTNQLPTTATFPFALNKTGTCGTITYSSVLQPNTFPPTSWVTSTNTQSSYTATVNLPQDAINYIPQMGAIYPLIGGVTATDVSGTSTTALWATVIGKTPPPVPTVSLDVAPLSGTAPLLVTATASTSGFSSAPDTYTFSFGDGSPSDVVATNVDLHTYNPTATTTYTVLVEAKNTITGQSAWTNKIVTVYPSNIDIGAKGTKTLSFSINPSTISLNRPAVGAPVTASFNGLVSWNTNLQSNANFSVPSWTGIPGSSLTYVPAANCSGSSASSPCTVSFTIGNITNTTPASTPFSVTVSKDGVSTSSPATLSLTDVTNPPTLSAFLSVAPSSGVGPLPVSATVSSTNGTAPYTYSVDFGDGYSVSSASAAHVYNAVNATTTYTVTGMVTDSAHPAASASATRSVTVYPTNQPAVIPVTCSLISNKLMGLPPLRPTFTVTPGGGNSGSYVVKLDPAGTRSPIYNLSSPYSSNTYIFTISGSYASQATVQDANNPSNSTTCQLTNGPMKVLSGSGGETNPGQ